MNNTQKALIIRVHAIVDKALEDDFCPGDLCDIEELITSEIKSLFNKYWEDSHTPEELAAIREDQKTWTKVQNPPTYSYIKPHT